jgi:hypothetical protein
VKLHPPDCVNLATDRVECPVCGGAGVLARVLDENVDLVCENCDGKGTLIRPTGRQHLSHSSLGMQLACQRRYQHAYVDRLEPIQRKSSLSLGSAFAKAVELRSPAAGAMSLGDGRGRLIEQEEIDRLTVDMVIVESAAAAYLSRYFFEDMRANLPEGARTDEHGVWMGSASALSFERKATEVEYLVRLRSPYTGAYSNTFDLYGRADGVVDHGAFLELTEDKLVGQIDSVSVKKTRGDRQLSLGAYALWRITGKPVRKVRKRFTKKPQIRQRKRESVAEFCERIRADYRERPDFYMHEETTFRDADDMLDVERSLWDWAEQRRAAQRRGFWPMNTDRCHDYGGCDFLDICFGGELGLYQRKPEKVTSASSGSDRRG